MAPIHEAAMEDDDDVAIRAELAKGVAVDERDPNVSCATGM